MRESKITIRLYEEDKQALKSIAEEKGVSMSDIIRALIDKYLMDKGVI